MPIDVLETLLAFAVLITILIVAFGYGDSM